MSNNVQTATKTTKRAFTTYEMTMVAIMTAIMCILSPFSIPIPISPVPLSLATFVVYMTACLLGWKLATISCALYLIIGLIGMPVFSSFGSGLGKLLGPTGGYLIAYLIVSVICGLAFEKYSNKFVLFFWLVVATIILYIFGTAWLCFQANLTFIAGLRAGVIPYIPGDLAKIILTIIIGPTLKKRLSTVGNQMQS
ncbi:MAG: biotin transporter BioY [Clostridiales bacterium]|nr:biotin transporter BioY [Clostridiales bacterium]